MVAESVSPSIQLNPILFLIEPLSVCLPLECKSTLGEPVWKILFVCEIFATVSCSIACMQQFWFYDAIVVRFYCYCLLLKHAWFVSSHISREELYFYACTIIALKGLWPSPTLFAPTFVPMRLTSWMLIFCSSLIFRARKIASPTSRGYCVF